MSTDMRERERDMARQSIGESSLGGRNVRESVKGTGSHGTEVMGREKGRIRTE